MDIFFFPLSWHSAGEEIQVFGWTCESSRMYNCCIRITDFHPYMYIKLPSTIKWSRDKCQQVIRTLKMNKRAEIQTCDAMKSRGIYSNILRPKSVYLIASFKTEKTRDYMRHSLSRPITVQGLGCVSLQCYEFNASSILQLICRTGITSSDWFTFKRCPMTDDPISKCEREYKISWKVIQPIKENAPSLPLPQPIIASYDIETFSHNPGVFCDPTHPEDVVFQISLVFGKQGTLPDTWEKYILSLGDPVLEDLSINIIRCKSEKQLLLKYAELIDEKNPNFIIGYNIFGFDNSYMVERSKRSMIFDEFVRHGCTFEKADVYECEWSSSAYGQQKIFYLDTKGRVHLDMYTIIRRDYKLDSYKLGSVAQQMLGRTKDPLTHYDIYDFYRLGRNGEPSKELGVVARYCVKDSFLVLELFEHLKCWYSLTSMAKICYVPLSYLFQRGQQIKVFSQVYKYCSDNSIVVENGAFKMPHENFVIQGAYVLDASAGLYSNVVSFDFASLYPSIIISHNIDYGSLVQPGDDIPDEKCHIIEWEEHFGCECSEAEPPKKIKGKTTIVCEKYKYRWLKEPKGVLPSIIQNLLAARKQVKASMKTLKDASIEHMLADNLQNAFKISANSMYGVLASRMGPLAFPIGGMCVTAIGRRSLTKVKSVLESEYYARVVYGDTDSAYVLFRGISLSDLEKHCLKVSDKISKLFPPPMRLEYEGKIYKTYFLMTKKRYAYLSHGKNNLEYKGILLKRRDSTKIIRALYKKLLLLIMDNGSKEQLETLFIECLSIIASGCSKPSEYAITSSLKSIDNFDIKPKSEMKVFCGAYVVSKLNEDPKKRAAQLKRKKIENEENFYMLSLPGHVQLALRMRERGQQIESGARLSIVYTKRQGLDAPAYIKMEELEYFETFYDRKEIDTVHYANLFLTPVEEIFAAYFGEDFSLYFKEIGKTVYKRARILEELKSLFCNLRFQ